MSENCFVVVDVETANSSYDSICQIGLVEFKDGNIVKEWVRLINPEDQFSSANTHIHGLTEKDITSAPTFLQVAPEMFSQIKDRYVCSFTTFDHVSLHRTAEKYNLTLPPYKHVDICKASRIAWPELENHKLKTTARLCGITFNHHDALEDARAAGFIFLEAMKLTKKTVTDWPLSRKPSKKKITTKKSESHETEVRVTFSPDFKRTITTTSINEEDKKIQYTQKSRKNWFDYVFPILLGITALSCLLFALSRCS